MGGSFTLQAQGPEADDVLALSAVAGNVMKGEFAIIPGNLVLKYREASGMVARWQ